MDGTAAAMANSIYLGANELDLIAGDLPSAEDLLDSADDAPAVRLINGVLAEAARHGVSDVHIEPYETGLVVRMRMDGVLKEMLRMPPHVAPVVVSRITMRPRPGIADTRTRQARRRVSHSGGRGPGDPGSTPPF